MIEQPLVQLLQTYNSICTQQQIIKQQMLDFLSNANCFERTCLPGHFTASAFLLDKDERGALLMHHRKLNQWLQLGGHCDGNNDLLAVAIKEAQEESGITQIIPLSQEIFDLDIHFIPPHKQDPQHLHYDVRFLLKVNSSESIQANHESLKLAWFNGDILPTNATSVTRLFDKWKNKWR
jgi:ADP-ribose pyrophosphatase YjhB (NUDIX family)